MVTLSEANSLNSVTLRDQVRAGLDNGGVDALADTTQIDPELLGTVLSHFADTASLADADVLAPVVTAASPVPFEPELDGVGGGEAASQALETEVDPDDFDRVADEPRDLEHEDPGAFDDVEPGDIAPEPVSAADRADGDEPDSEPEDAFGSGGTPTEAAGEPWETVDEPKSFADTVGSDPNPFESGDAVDAAVEPARDFDPDDFDTADTQPELGGTDDVDFME